MRQRGLIAVVALAVLAGCSPEDTVASTTTTEPTVTTTTMQEASTSVPPSTTTTAEATTTSAPPQGETVTVLLYPFGEMGPEWTETVFPYGTGEDTLGTAPGGEGLTLGPEYGTQLADETWWFMDAAKQRLAHFDAEATFIGTVPVPEEVLVDGQYFQFQNPIALDDDTVIASGFRGEASTSLMMMSDEVITETIIDESVPWVTTDGALLFGFSAADSQPSSLDPSVMEATDTEWFLARDGSRYMVTLADSELVVELPDSAVTKTLQLRFSENPDVGAGAGIEVETGVDGSLFILFYGAPISDEIFGIGSLVRIRPDGYVEEAQPVIDPFSPADPGSPSHLGVTAGTSNPWLMVVAEDGVHVYVRS